MHELTEAYEGAKMSINQKKSSAASNNAKSVYLKAHKRATYQPQVYQRMFDINGELTTDILKAQRVEWFVKPYSESNKETIIQTFP